jgi:LPS O-antigen subunit length determinant protein (WzzB/FepE family)
MRFASAPSSYKESKPSKPVGLLLGLMVGGMGGCFLALFLSWWKKDSMKRSV